MVKLTNDDTKHVAKLARLNLTDEEIKKFSTQLSAVLDYVDQLSEVDTTGIEPTAQTTGLTNVLREDLIKPENCLSQETAVSGKDDTKNGYFVVPQILQK
jgi:aspartyl-tRNA(Asn)/glutamyl-tRNA(Gln) amidotransferase subunit C